MFWCFHAPCEYGVGPFVVKHPFINRTKGFYARQGSRQRVLNVSPLSYLCHGHHELFLSFEREGVRTQSRHVLTPDKSFYRQEAVIIH